MSGDLEKLTRQTPLFEDSGAVGAPVEIEVGEFWPLSHWFAGVDFFDDEDLTIPSTVTGGTVAVTVVSKTTDKPSDVPGSPIDATAIKNVEINFATNPDRIIFTPDSIVGAAFMRVRAVGNEN